LAQFTMPRSPTKITRDDVEAAARMVERITSAIDQLARKIMAALG
jgi:hypothetical protein